MGAESFRVPLAPLLLALLALPAQEPIRREAAPESRPGTPAPDFELADLSGEPFRLSERVAEAHVLLVFVRGMW